jgi:hypothetical protein
LNHLNAIEPSVLEEDLKLLSNFAMIEKKTFAITRFWTRNELEKQFKGVESVI